MRMGEGKNRDGDAFTYGMGLQADMGVYPENGSWDPIPRIWIGTGSIRIIDPTLSVFRQIH